MSKRLDKIASYVKSGKGIVDVGTDHGYIPLMLLARGYEGNVIATDINESPLSKARACLYNEGYEDRAELILCDGLDGCDPEKIDTIIVAGMGGDTITGILDRAEWCSEKNVSLILQPVTKPEILRYWLTNNEFSIHSDDYVKENGTVYQIIYAKPGKQKQYSDAELFVGSFEALKKSEYCEEILAQHIKRFSNAVAGLENTERTELKAWKKLMGNILKDLMELYDEYKS